MATATIELEVDRETARKFSKASAKDRRKLNTIWSLLVQGFAGSSGDSLGRLMDEISDNAAQRGLTPEKLKDILHAH